MDDDLSFDLPWDEGRTPSEFSAQIFGSDSADESERAAGLVLEPFRGVRYAPGVPLRAVTSPPYDLIDDEAIERLLAADPHNIVRLILPVGDPAGRYAQARDTLRSWRANGTLVTDPTPALYVYEQRGHGLLQRGLIGAVGLRAEAAGVVLPHEDVFPGPVQDRLRLMGTTRSNLEPIFLVYEGGGVTGQIVDRVAAFESPQLEVSTDDGLTHRMWRLSAPSIHVDISADLRNRQALIADGHHRYATYRALQALHRRAGAGPGPWDHGLALLVDSAHYPPRLAAIHRVIPELPVSVAVERAKGAFQVTEITRSSVDAPATSSEPRPRQADAAPDPLGPLGPPQTTTGSEPSAPDGQPGSVEAEAGANSLEAALNLLKAESGPAFLIGGNGRLFLLTEPDPVALSRAMPTDRSARWRQLDTAILDHLLIKHLWGITEDEYTVEIVHHDSSAALLRAHRLSGTAVIMNPLSVSDVLAIATGGERVPRKSTSFGPKPRTGLILRLFDVG